MVLQSVAVFAQGCSDAGICSLDSYLHDNEIFKNIITISPGYGVGDADVTYLTGALSYTRIVNPKWTLNGRVTYSQADAPLVPVGNLEMLLQPLPTHLNKKN